MDKEYIEYLSSTKWKQFRDTKIKKYKNCFVCSSFENLHVHHISYKKVFNERNEDVVLLCKDCHHKAHLINNKCKSLKIFNALPTIHKRMLEYFIYKKCINIDAIANKYSKRRKKYWKTYKKAMLRKQKTA